MNIPTFVKVVVAVIIVAIACNSIVAVEGSSTRGGSRNKEKTEQRHRQQEFGIPDRMTVKRRSTNNMYKTLRRRLSENGDANTGMVATMQESKHD
jgi:hypothetical protein